MSKILIKKFNELSLTELYAILQLRSEVFVVEQDCVYQDIDFKDQKAIHLFYTKNDQVIAYTRLFGPGNYFKEASIGRVIVQKKFRKEGFGHQLMDASIQTITEKFKTSIITISAQTYLQKFYESHNFNQIGEAYLEDGIPHIKMIKK